MRMVGMLCAALLWSGAAVAADSEVLVESPGRVNVEAVETELRELRERAKQLRKVRDAEKKRLRKEKLQRQLRELEQAGIDPTLFDACDDECAASWEVEAG